MGDLVAQRLEFLVLARLHLLRFKAVDLVAFALRLHFEALFLHLQLAQFRLGTFSSSSRGGETCFQILPLKGSVFKFGFEGSNPLVAILQNKKFFDFREHLLNVGR